MNVNDAHALAGAAAMQPGAQGPRAVDEAASGRFRELMAAPECARAPEGCAVQRPLRETFDMDIEKIVMANLPAPGASSAEFAVGMLRAQVKVSQAAIAIELVSKTTQSLSQGVQSLTTRS